jgi:hypothetical protein
MNYYNGYSPEDRERKLAASHRKYSRRSDHPCSKPPCHMCGDPDAPVAPHSEDYSDPYHWEPPFTFALCPTCHARLHRRFAAPASWLSYKRHLRRGGYGSDLKSAKIAREVSRLAKSLKAGKPFDLPLLARNKTLTGSEWWEFLSTDARILTERWARPRP